MLHRLLGYFSKRGVKLIPFKKLPANELGPSIMHLKENGATQSTTDTNRRGVIIAKVCSFGSTTLGLVMMPVLTSRAWDAMQDQPGTMAFVVGVNVLLGVLTFTPLLLNFITKRFIANIYYNPETKMFTTLHYSFFLQKKALRIQADEVVDAAASAEMRRLWFPLATCFIHSRPLLLSLDRKQYRDKEAFDLLTKNINIPSGHD